MTAPWGVEELMVLWFVAAHALMPPQSKMIKIDFEGLPAMTFHTGNPIPQQARLHDQYVRSYGVIFRSGSPYVAVMEQGAGHAVSGVNSISGSTPDGILTYSREHPVEIAFVDPKDPEHPATTDFVSIRMDLASNTGRYVTLEAYDAFGDLLDSVTMPDMPGGALKIRDVKRRIHMVRFLGHATNGIGLDDLAFNRVVPLRRQKIRGGSVVEKAG